MSEQRGPKFLKMDVKKDAGPPGVPHGARESGAPSAAEEVHFSTHRLPASEAQASLFDRADVAAEAVRALTKGIAPSVAVVLGSGLGAFGDGLESARPVSYEQIPGFPRSTVVGHKGRLIAGFAGGIPVYAMQGRFHFYEGYTLEEVTFPVRVFARLGVRAIVITNAAGGIGAHLDAGDLMVLTDHLNLMGRNPLRGPNDERFGPRFPDMTDAYSSKLREVLLSTAKTHAAAIGCAVKSGVYAALPGPSYETPAEIRMLRTLGADAVGMSTVPETIVAVQSGLQVCAVSGIANKAAGMVEGHRLSHEEVVGVMNKAGSGFRVLIEKSLPGIAAAVEKA